MRIIGKYILSKLKYMRCKRPLIFPRRGDLGGNELLLKQRIEYG